MGKVVSVRLNVLCRPIPLTSIHSPVCQKEVLNSIPETSNDEEEGPHGDINNDSERPLSKIEVISRRKPDSRPRERQADLDENDISIFKRIVQQILDRGSAFPELQQESDGRDATWGPEMQNLYNEFLADERMYIMEGLWDRFPIGSRLFIGKQ
jgi:hypothetical protein